MHEHASHCKLGRDCYHQTGKSSQRSRELKMLRQRYGFMLWPHPPGVSSKPFSRPQKVPRLNVTLADRCTRKKVDRVGFFCTKKAALGRASHLSEKTSSGSLLLPGRSRLTRELGASWQEEETATWRKVKTILLLHSLVGPALTFSSFV